MAAIIYIFLIKFLSYVNYVRAAPSFTSQLSLLKNLLIVFFYM